MNAGQHGAVKAAVCGFSLAEARALAERALTCKTQEEVLALLEQDRVQGPQSPSTHERSCFL